MRSIDCAQRYTRQIANLRLGFPIFPQQYHLDTLSNDRVALALQRLFRRSTWSLLHLTIRSPLRISQIVLPNHIQGTMASPSLEVNADAQFRFKSVWKWYHTAGRQVGVLLDGERRPDDYEVRHQGQSTFGRIYRLHNTRPGAMLGEGGDVLFLRALKSPILSAPSNKSGAPSTGSLREHHDMPRTDYSDPEISFPRLDIRAIKTDDDAFHVQAWKWTKPGQREPKPLFNGKRAGSYADVTEFLTQIGKEQGIDISPDDVEWVNVE
jgi:hypothetical protein